MVDDEFQLMTIQCIVEVAFYKKKERKLKRSGEIKRLKTTKPLEYWCCKER